MHVEAKAALAQAELHAQHGDDAPRIDALGRAARRFLPWGASARARQALAALGRAGNAQAYRTLRASILAARWLVTPAPDLLSEANRALARETPEYLVPTPQPSVPFTVVALVGLACFIVGVARSTRASLPTAIAGLAMMFVGLWRA